jgi:branched-chain amino acid transport system substrate-binding protein
MKSLAALVLIAFATAACQGGSNGSGQPDVVIASDFPTSAYGGPRLWEQAIDFAVRQQSTIDGYSLAYLRYDDSMGSEQNPLAASSNVRRMIADSRVLGLVTATSFAAFVELPATNRASLAMISPSVTNECITASHSYCRPTVDELRPGGTTTFFRISPRDPLQGQAIADYAVKHLGVHRVAAFNELGDVGTLYINELSDELRKQGAELVYVQDLPRGTDKFSDFLGAAKNLGATAVYAVADASANACLAAAQMSALMPGAIFLGTDAITSAPTCIQQMGASPPDAWATMPVVDRTISTDAAVKERAEAFLKAYPEKKTLDPLTAYRLAAYDCARILIEAIAKAIHANGGHIPTRSQVVTALASNRFVEATGIYAFDRNGDAAAPMMSVYKFQNSGWVFADVYPFGSP